MKIAAWSVAGVLFLAGSLAAGERVTRDEVWTSADGEFEVPQRYTAFKRVYGGTVEGTIRWGPYTGTGPDVKDEVKALGTWDSGTQTGKAEASRTRLLCRGKVEDVAVSKPQRAARLSLGLEGAQTTRFSAQCSWDSKRPGARFLYVSRTRGRIRGDFMGGNVFLTLNGGFRAVDMSGIEHSGAIHVQSGQGPVTTTTTRRTDLGVTGGVTNTTGGSVSAGADGTTATASGERTSRFRISCGASSESVTTATTTAPVSFASDPYVQETRTEFHLRAGQERIIEREVEYHWSLVYQVTSAENGSTVFEGGLDEIDFGTTTVRWVIEPYAEPPAADSTLVGPPVETPVVPSSGNKSGTTAPKETLPGTTTPPSTPKSVAPVKITTPAPKPLEKTPLEKTVPVTPVKPPVVVTKPAPVETKPSSFKPKPVIAQ